MRVRREPPKVCTSIGWIISAETGQDCPTLNHEQVHGLEPIRQKSPGETWRRRGKEKGDEGIRWEEGVEVGTMY